MSVWVTWTWTGPWLYCLVQQWSRMLGPYLPTPGFLAGELY